jgi:hypothetical protein
MQNSVTHRYRSTIIVSLFMSAFAFTAIVAAFGALRTEDVQQSFYVCWRNNTVGGHKTHDFGCGKPLPSIVIGLAPNK